MSPLSHPRGIAAALAAVLCFSASSIPALRAEDPPPLPQGVHGNRAERLEWFRDLGFGMFIHWGVDSQIGSVISHSMVGADDSYLDRFTRELPATFNPTRFEPESWAALAKLAGMRYVVFTAKHHSGFAMWRTDTTRFGIKNTPFQQDITTRIFDAFRARDIAAGVYFSPEDFLWLRENNLTIERGSPTVKPVNQPGLMKLARTQLAELLSGHGKIDLLFLDGDPVGLRDLGWEMNRDLVVTRGAIPTPEQTIPGVALDTAWESCLTMGTQWQYKPTNENYKAGREIISLLVETRAKGGNLLLNVGPKPNGELPIEQEERLREVALWMFVNSECIHGVRPWIITNENDYWFTRKKDSDTVYVIVKDPDRWPNGAWKDIVLRSIKATPETVASVLGQNDRSLEYQLDVIPKTTWEQKDDGLRVRAMRAQRLYNDRKWPNPVVIKLTHVQPALVPPLLRTLAARWDRDGTPACEAEVQSLGDSSRLRARAEFRDITGMDWNERTSPWVAGPEIPVTAPGRITLPLPALNRQRTYEVRASIIHPLLIRHGNEVRMKK